MNGAVLIVPRGADEHCLSVGGEASWDVPKVIVCESNPCERVWLRKGKPVDILASFVVPSKQVSGVAHES
jgi:hypothetical protein